MSKQERSTGTLPAAAIREQLQRMLVRPPFLRSPVLSRFLAHVVEHALGSDGPPLKEYAIGLEVFDRPDDFDPRIDTIVRVQARRLRAALDAYYRDEGARDPVRLQMPKGQYGIHVRHPAESQANDAEEAFPAPVMDAGSSRLPAARTPLIGRENELAQLLGMIRDDGARLLTITGVGGTGKTRLLLEAAQAVQDDYPGGVLFVDLSAVNQCDLLIDMLASVFRVKNAEGMTPAQAIVQRIRASTRQRTLLVLDNFEGVLACADVIGTLLDATPLLSVLVTSRVALKLYGEHEFPLGPLQVPDPARHTDSRQLAAVPAMQLFLARAEAANPRAKLDRHLNILAELCVRLDGLPLAIELVAAMAGTLSPQQMLDRFSGHLDLPENPARDAPSRQRTLRRTIDWSYELLDDAGRVVLRRLSVFAGGFTLEAAEAVVDSEGHLGARLLPAVNALVAMGLLYFSTSDSEPRYAMLETLRAYARERLNASGEAEAVGKALAAYCLVLAEEGVARLDGTQRETWLIRCDLEQDNFRQALDFLLRNGPHLWTLRLGHALFFYWERRERVTEGRHQLQRIMDTVDPQADTMLWARIGIFVATLAGMQGDQDVAICGMEDMLGMYRRLEDRKGEADALSALGVCERLRGNDDRAVNWLREALDLIREVGDQNEIAAAVSNLAQCEMHLGHYPDAHALLGEARELFQQCGNAQPAAWCLNHMGDAARLEGDLVRADELYAQAEAEFDAQGDLWGIARTRDDRCRLAIERGEHAQAGPVLLQVLSCFDSLDHQRGMAAVTESIAAFALASGHPDLAVKLVTAAESWRAALGFAPRPDDLVYPERILEQAREQLAGAEFEVLRDAGRGMLPEDVAELLRGILEEGDDQPG